jgi:hypothetical protein
LRGGETWGIIKVEEKLVLTFYLPPKNTFSLSPKAPLHLSCQRLTSLAPEEEEFPAKDRLFLSLGTALSSTLSQSQVLSYMVTSLGMKRIQEYFT